MRFGAKDGLDGPSWRNGTSPDGMGNSDPNGPPRPRKMQRPPTNVKKMDGVPYELLSGPVPRIHGVLPSNDASSRKKQFGPPSHHANPHLRHIRNSPPLLDSISERNNSSSSQSPPPTPEVYRTKDATASSSDLANSVHEPEATSVSPDPKKAAQKSYFSRVFPLKTKARD